jgi:hypothetical protein
MFRVLALTGKAKDVFKFMALLAQYRGKVTLGMMADAADNS